MACKLFIVDPDNERLLATLRTALANETDVEILYDRRGRGVRSGRWRGQERRTAPDVSDRVRSEGFAVVRPAPPLTPERNVRWA